MISRFYPSKILILVPSKIDFLLWSFIGALLYSHITYEQQKIHIWKNTRDKDYKHKAETHNPRAILVFIARQQKCQPVEFLLYHIPLHDFKNPTLFRKNVKYCRRKVICLVNYNRNYLVFHIAMCHTHLVYIYGFQAICTNFEHIYL